MSSGFPHQVNENIMPSRKRHNSIEGCCICGIDTSAEPFLRAQDISTNRNVSSAEVYQNCFNVEEKSGDLCIDCLSIAKRWLKMKKSTRQKTNFKEASIVDSKRSPKLSNLKCKGRPRRASALNKEMDEETVEDSKTVEDSESKQENISDPDQENEKENSQQESKKIESTASPTAIEDALSEDDTDMENIEEDIDMEVSSAVAFDTPSLSPGKPDNAQDENLTRKEMISVATQTAFLFPALTSPQANANKLPFIDLSKWRQENICCGTIFRGPNGEVLVDPKWLRSSCEMCNRSSQPPTPVDTSKPKEISVFDEKLANLCS
eukprot:gene12806-14119_t